MKLFILIMFATGVLFTGIFIHEGIHWLQYSDIEEKQICFFGYGKIVYLNPISHIIWLTDEEHFKRELEAHLFSTVFFIFAIIYGFKHIKRREKNGTKK